ncbi:MAG: glycosyltransferase [Lachnospiraceae bacterium]|nr:glycosyltransferase [Lachnospiraceae bacterium]
MVKVSVIVPVYNTESMLENCIESLLAQTLKEIEIIFVDDKSTDSSTDILYKYQKKDHRINIICNEENIGAALSRNRGLDIAKGKYIQFVDSDDYLEPDALENLYILSEQHNSEMCYLGMHLHIENNISETGLREGILRNYPKVYNGREIIGEFVKNNDFFLYLCSVFYKSSFIKENGLRYKKLSIGEGGDFILRALCLAEKVIVCPKKYYRYRIHEKSISRGANAKIKLLIGQITQYIDILQYYSQHEDAVGLQPFLEDQYKKIAGGILNLSASDKQDVEKGLETAFAKYIFRILQQETKIYGIEFSEEILTRIRQKSHVIIYGAGYVSKEIIELLQKYGIEIAGFAVTKRNEAQRSMYGHHIYEIQELKAYKDDAIVLIAANKIYNQEIEGILEKHGFRDYVCLNVEI